MVIFKAKLRKLSKTSWGVTIPHDYIKNGLVSTKKRLKIDILEGDEDESST